MQVQSNEELGHANRFFKYIVERGGKVTLQAIPEPKCEYKSPLDAFKASLGHEQKVSAAICAIYELAAAEKDYATLSFLKWFLDEQVEEERNVGDMLAKLELVGDNPAASTRLIGTPRAARPRTRRADPDFEAAPARPGGGSDCGPRRMPYRTFGIEEVARYLHLSRADVERLVKDQDIPFERHGRAAGLPQGRD